MGFIYWTVTIVGTGLGLVSWVVNALDRNK